MVILNTMGMLLKILELKRIDELLDVLNIREE